MSEFEYLAIFVSIIFGISVTHLLSGAINAVYHGKLGHTRGVLTAFFFIVLVLNWWTGYTLNEHQQWSFDLYLLVIVWSVLHYVAAITLYPPASHDDPISFETHQSWFMWSFIGVASLDMAQMAATGNVLEPWYLLPFVVHYIVLALVAIFFNNPSINRWIAWYFLLTMLVWALVVRRLLA